MQVPAQFRSKLRDDYKSAEAAAIMFGSVMMASTLSNLFNQHPELTSFEKKVQPDAEKVAAIVGDNAQMVRAIQAMATDPELVFQTFMKAFWGGCHMHGRDFKDRKAFSEFCKIRDVDCYLYDDNMVGVGFNHPVAAMFNWSEMQANFAGLDSDFFGPGEFELPDTPKHRAAMRRFGGIDISKLH